MIVTTRFSSNRFGLGSLAHLVYIIIIILLKIIIILVTIIIKITLIIVTKEFGVEIIKDKLEMLII